MAFYKLEDGGNFLEAPNFVLNKDFELRAETYQDHEYPIDGWYWFDTPEEAYVFFDYTPPDIEG